MQEERVICNRPRTITVQMGLDNRINKYMLVYSHNRIQMMAQVNSEQKGEIQINKVKSSDSTLREHSRRPHSPHTE